MVPVLYSIFVLDLKILTWEAKEEPELTDAQTVASASPAVSHD